MKRPLMPFAVSLLVLSSRPRTCPASSHAHNHHHRGDGAGGGAHPVLNAATASESGTPSPCPLRCDNGGVCRHGVADASSLHPVHSMYTPIDAPFLDASHSSHHSRAHCVCPAGYVGPTCAVALEKCHGTGGGGKGRGHDHHCFHGAACRVGISDTGSEFYYCECSKAGRAKDGGMNRHHFYAGHMCQHASTTVCGLENGTKDGRHAGEGGGDGSGDRRGLNGSFCTNWGTCREGSNGEEHPGCDCPDKWEGPHCEYRKGTDQWAHASPQHQSSLSSENGTEDDSSTSTGAENLARDETSSESRKRRSGLVFVIVAVVFSAIGMSFPQIVKWWRKREEARRGDGDIPAAEVTISAENMDPDGTTSMSSVSISEAETITVTGDAASVTIAPPPPPLPPPATDVLV